MPLPATEELHRAAAGLDDLPGAEIAMRLHRAQVAAARSGCASISSASRPGCGAISSEEIGIVNKARRKPVSMIAAQTVLIVYTLIALFPVFVILINSFKTRKAIFRHPLALPDTNSFSLIGYQTVLKQGDFFGYFQNSLIVTVVSLFLILLFGAMAAFALSMAIIPVMVLYVIFSRQLIRGITSGAVK